jgi:hypothetical protein
VSRRELVTGGADSFGLSSKEKEDIGNITKDAVAAGLLRLPRSMLIAEKVRRCVCQLCVRQLHR